MTVDGLILENLIRELITSEFTGIINMSKVNECEIARLKNIIVIES